MILLFAHLHRQPHVMQNCPLYCYYKYIFLSLERFLAHCIRSPNANLFLNHKKTLNISTDRKVKDFIANLPVNKIPWEVVNRIAWGLMLLCRCFVLWIRCASLNCKFVEKITKNVSIWNYSLFSEQKMNFDTISLRCSTTLVLFWSLFCMKSIILSPYVSKTT